MSHLARKLFRPGQASTHARFTTAYVNGATAYPGDLVCWDTTAPTSQGASGVVNGQTLGATDYIFVQIPPAAVAAAQGLQAGIVQGPSIQRATANGTASVMADDSLIVIQTWGVCPDVYAVTNASSAAGVLCVTGATSGAVTQVVATDVLATDSAGAEPGKICGFALNAQATDHVRGTVATEPGLDMFVRCDW